MPRQRRRKTISIAAVLYVAPLLIFTNHSVADNSSLDQMSEISIEKSLALETIVVTGRRSQQQFDSLSGSVGKVSKEEIQRTAHAHISQMTARLPGVWLSRGNGQELLASVRSPVFTGAGSCAEILTTEDGLPIRPTGMCNVNQLFEVNTEQAAGLEVWRGPGTVFYGSNAMHGVINIISPNISTNNVSLQLGSNQYRRIKLGWKGNQDTHALQVAANGVSDGGFKDDSGFDQQKISVTHDWSDNLLSAKTYLTAVNLNQETSGYIKGRNAYKDDAIWKTNPNPEAYRDGSAVRLSTRFIGSSTDSYQWQVNPYVRRSSMTFLQHYLPGQAEEKNGQTSAGIHTSYQIKDDVKTLWVGVDVEWADMWVKEFQENILGVADNVRFQGQHYDFDVKSRQYALFANSEWQVSDKMTVDVGLRYESLNYDYKNNMISGSSRDDGRACNSSSGSCRYFRPTDRSDTTDNVNVQIGLLYTLSATLNAYIRAANAFRAPQINELYRLQKEQSIAVIQPEKLDSIESGLRYQVQNLTAQLSIYLMKKEQVIVKDSDSFVVNDGKTRHQGIEWQLGYQLSENWQIATAGAWAKHEYQYTRLYGGTNIKGNDVDTAPRWQGSAHLNYQPSENTQMELEWVYLGNYYLDPQNAHEYAGHNTFNLRGQHSYGDWELSAQVTNITDRHIADRADYAFGSYRYFVGEGRGFSLALKRQF
jgi:iron complex outermembrane receptor protein